MDDLPHHGVKAFNWLNRVFKPMYHLHGHVHIYRSDTIIETQLDNTRVMNTYGYKEITLDQKILDELLIHPRKRAKKANQDE
jgi:Icc-related predicted phosphoesterase